MPVSLNRHIPFNAETQRALQRIAGQTLSSDELSQLENSWQKSDADHELAFAVFNERNVGFAYLKGAEIQAFVVHSATRSRGVGGRFVALLAEQIDGLCVSDTLDSGFLDHALSR